MDKNLKASFGQSASDIGLNIEKPLILIGLMGVGKTTVGRRLAKKLDLPFVDADEEIEKAAGLTIAEIFERFGEDYFRDGERRVIARLIEDKPQVIATGGGAFMNCETRQLILQNSKSIWLDADIEILVERVSRRDTRPLLKTGDPGEILRKLAKDRNPIYAKAHVHVTGNDSPHDQTVNKIIEALAE